MLNIKNICAIGIILTTISSCGVISKTRYGNSYKINIESHLFDRKTMGSNKITGMNISGKYLHRKNHIISNPKEIQRVIDFKDILTSSLNPYCITSSDEYNTCPQNSVIINSKTEHSLSSNNINKGKEIVSNTRRSLKSGYFYENKKPDKGKESTAIIILKVVLTIIMFASMAVLYIVSAITLIFIGIFTFGLVTEEEVQLFRSVTKLAKVSFQGIWSEW